MGDFLKSYGTLILAVYGIAQVWFIHMWRKFYRPGRIEIYETGTIEIGYSSFGPTLGLNGTLRAINKDVFIKSIELSVVREKDRATHILNWIAFRPPKIDLAGNQPTLMEIPSGFMVTLNSPHRYNIAYNDNLLLNEFRPSLNEYISEWYKIAEQLNRIWPPTMGTATPPEIISQQAQLIDDFTKGKTHLETYTMLNEKFYWESGNYSLFIKVISSKPNKIFSNTYKFAISDSDSKSLRLNVITILNEPIAGYFRGQNYPYNFAYSEYK